ASEKGCGNRPPDYVAAMAQSRHAAQYTDLQQVVGSLSLLAITGECVRDFAQRAVDRSLVVHDELALDRLRKADIRARPTGIEEWRRGDAPMQAVRRKAGTRGGARQRPERRWMPPPLARSSC